MISVIIPTFNRAEMIETAVASVLAQNLAPAEILIVDDGSSDDTEQRIDTVARTARIPVLYLRQPNRGPAAARNRGIAAASADTLAFLDSDDSWHRQKLEIQYKAMQSSATFLVSHTRETWYRKGRFLNQKRRHRPPHGMIFNHCLNLCCVGMSTVMAHRELFTEFGLFDESLRCCEDYDLWLRVAAHRPFLLVDRALTVKQGGRADQVSVHYRQGMDRFRIQALARLLCTSSLSAEQRHRLSDELIRKCLIYGRGCNKHGRELEGGHYLRVAGWAARTNNTERE